jgi:hypothetical protein
MDALNPVKQWISMQKNFFDNAYEATCRLQDQAIEMNDSLCKSMPFMSDPGKKMIDDAVAMGQKARDSYKKALDDGFTSLEALFNAGK